MKRIDNGRRMEFKNQPDWMVKVDRAIVEAPDLMESDLRDKEIGVKTAEFIAGKIDVDEYRMHDKEYAADTRGQVRFVDAQQFEEALLWILRKNFPGHDANVYIARAKELREHEEEHYIEAEKYQLKRLVYLVRFFHDGNGISFRPGISFDLPDDINADELRALMRLVIEAPDELSDLDEDMLQ